MKARVILLLLTGMFILNSLHSMAQSETPGNNPDKLVVLWTSDDPYIAERVALMYTHAAKTNAWFDNVTLIIWGHRQS